MFIPGAAFKAHKRRQRATQRGLAFMGRTAVRAFSRPRTQSGWRPRTRLQTHLRTRARSYFR